ncbi:unnamed protein product [Linum trigynum]|uniref:Uncharacterized protein n=1 Tax=Linum trigynum TaxID=586398 RepID=A0AAV2CSL2_9ROSI
MEQKRNWDLIVEQIAWGTNEGCSNSGVEELLRRTKRQEELIEQACAQLAHSCLPPFEEKEEVEVASHETLGRTSSGMDFYPLPPPGLTLEEKVAQACESYRLSLLEENEEVERASNDNRVEQEELSSESSCGEDEQERCIDDSHHFTLPESNFEDQDTSEEEQEKMKGKEK